MKYQYLIFTIFLLLSVISYSQNKYVKIYLPQYSTYFDIPDSYNIGDTLIWKVTKDKYIKIVFFDLRGRSYCEVYDGENLMEKGHYINSLDTLKRYSSSVSAMGKRKKSKISILKYFQPLKDGEWIERRKNKLLIIRYNVGQEL